MEISQNELKKIFAKYDKNQNNFIDRQEFLEIMKDIMKKVELLSVYAQFAAQAKNVNLIEQIDQ